MLKQAQLDMISVLEGWGPLCKHHLSSASTYEPDNTETRDDFPAFV